MTKNKINVKQPVLYCLFVSTILSGVVVSNKLPESKDNQFSKLHHEMTKEEIKQYFGVDTHEEVPEYDVTHPFQVDESGNFVSYELHEHARRKRNADQPDVFNYKIKAFGLSLHLNLTTPSTLFRPGFVVETFYENGSKKLSEPPYTAFFNGHVTSDPNSIVAISNHNGLKGLVNFMGISFFIQPLPNHLTTHNASKDGSRSHLIYKRSLLDKVKSKCDLEGERTKRSLSEEKETKNSSSGETRPYKEKYLEVMVVADHLYLRKFNNDNEATEILLTLIHMVNSMFHDYSIGPIRMTLAVVRISLLHHELSYSDKDKNGPRLAAMQVWINEGNMPMSDVDPQHADHVILVTGDGFGGIASFASVCKHNSYGVCVNNGDLGLGTALIIAHETAHAIGVDHDGSTVDCPDSTFIMSKATPGGKYATRWSPCSRKQIQDFLSGSASRCLDDKPTLNLTSSQNNHYKLPGQLYDGDAQCALQMGPSYRFCKQKQSNCGSLFCTRDGSSCSSNIAPPADGTKCGERQWCIKGECVDNGSPMIDGNWSAWSDYTVCTFSCGGGVQHKTRTCTNPPPQNGGMDCKGEFIGQWRVCNPQACPKGKRTHREEQCETKTPGSVPHSVKHINPCSLLCRRGSRVVPFGTVIDGTRCSLNTKIKDVCIEGKCRSVGCDDVLESGVKEDRCKVCNGDGTSCKTVSGNVQNPCAATCTVLDVPIGATNVTVKEVVEDWNFLGVRDDEGHDVYPVAYTWSTRRNAAGTIVYYKHEKNQDADEVFIPGPTNEHLYVYYKQYVSRQPVSYKLNEPVIDGVHPSVSSKWSVSQWNKCSQTCAVGIQTRTVECVSTEDNLYLNEAVCGRHSAKPATVQQCNTHTCSPSWYVSGWRPCSKTCGKGVQKRQILCRQQVTRDHTNTLPDSKCTAPKPNDAVARDCNKIDCPAENVPGEWSACSTSCKPGFKTRKTSCKRLKEDGVLESVPDILCVSAIKLPLQESCNQDVPCPGDRLYEPLGCYADDRNDRALPILISNFRKGIDWTDMSKTIDKCAKQTTARDHKLKVFALQFYGECYSGYDGLKTFNKYGAKYYSDTYFKNCWKGVGAINTNFVYKFKE
ncbi:A disintegrin and metalloproteinase with thrombospondin motifs 6-like isoform X4 [Acropora millepora]|nr:A disintegrin and metalloproteinase with thrombospondin motifs 6-like isoform X4 [Acropora millepora]